MIKMKLREKIKKIEFAKFLGGFVSEGNLVEDGTVKITNSNLEFLYDLIECAKNIFGDDIVTNKPPTLEHKIDKSKFAYHKYFSRNLGKFLMNYVGIKPGKRILNDDSLPIFIFNWSSNKKEEEIFKAWVKNYLQARFSGDGWVHLEKKWIGITKVRALKLNSKLKKELLSLYSKDKEVKDYPKIFIERLKKIARKKNNLPKEFKQIIKILIEFFGIESRIGFVGIRSIYFDNKRKKIIVSGSYHFIISKRENIKKFKEEINFLELDKSNRKRLDFILENNGI